MTQYTYPVVPLPKVTPGRRVYEISSTPVRSNDTFLTELLSRRLSEAATTESLIAAMTLKKTLTDHKLNIVTAESLTAGMITKTLVDIPGNGAAVYGGFVVYDTDAKRKFINVTTEGVYSILTAQQMAAGALENSRAMVGLAVSGNAMPFPEDKEELGVVYIGVALRLADKILVHGKKVMLCNDREVQNMCDGWKTLNKDSKYAPFQYTSILADYIRLRTVTEACNEANAIIMDTVNKYVPWGRIDPESYDTVCHPSWIIDANLSTPMYSTECDPNSADLI